MKLVATMAEMRAGINDPRLGELCRHWQETYEQASYVDYENLNFEAIPHTLPLLFLIDVPTIFELTPERIRYRFVGMEVARSLGIDATGMTIAEVITQDAAQDFTLAIKGLLKKTCILHSIHTNNVPNVTEIRTERLVLPMSERSGRITGFSIAYSRLQRSPHNRLHEKSTAQTVWPEIVRKLLL